MGIRVVEYADGLCDALMKFNARLAAGDSTVCFPPPPDHEAAPPTFHQGLKVTRYLALEEGSGKGVAVRGAYALKFQQFWLSGEVIPVADFMLPVSEGIVRRAYALVAVRLLFDALERQPLLYGLGMGGFDQAVARLLEAAGWQMFSVPFFFYVVHPYPFLRNIVHLRTSRFRRTALDMLACSGVGWAATCCWNAFHAWRIGMDRDLRTEKVPDFEEWSDRVWETARPHYGMCSLRDAATLRRMYPREAERFQRIKVLRGEKPIGWALLLKSDLCGHSHFGNMRLGTIVDCFAEPAHAPAVVRQACAVLVKQGVDLVVSNQSHRAWCAALKGCGFVAGPSNFIFSSSKALTREMEKKQVRPHDIHVNRGDGDGPINL